MNDFSQWGEQTIILQFFDGKPPGRFLDLGAFDGLTGSNTRCLSDRYWHGVCVEACSRAFERLLANHLNNDKILCVNAAVIPNGFKYICCFEDAGDQIGTIYTEHRLGALVKHKWYVGCATPQDIAITFGDRFEFVSIDIEGLDLHVISSLGPLLEYTQLVCFEDTIPNTPFDPVYYDRLLSAWKKHGFTKVVGRTYAKTNNQPANTLLTR